MIRIKIIISGIQTKIVKLEKKNSSTDEKISKQFVNNIFWIIFKV